MPPRPRALALALSAVLSLPAATPAPVAAWRAQVTALLERRAAAVARGDERAFASTMRFAPAAFRAAKTTWLRRTRALGVASYALALEEDGYEDLAGALRAPPRGADEVHVVEATERLAIAGYDERPAADDLFLTVVRRGSDWSVVSDDDLDDLGLLSARNLWDFAPVRRVERAGVLVLYHADPAAARRILDASVAAIAYVKGHWPLRWRARAVVAIPRTTVELARILRTPVDLGPFVAFTSSSVDRERGGFRLTGHRIYVQPATFFRSPARFQRDVLSHEVLHLATRSIAGPYTPAWLDEGVAQVYGERAPQPTADLARRARDGDVRGLPLDFTFAVGGRAEIRTAYQASAHFIEMVRDRFGAGAGARLYRAVGAERAVSFGTARYHHDHAARAALGGPLDALERAWMALLRREFGS